MFQPLGKALRFRLSLPRDGIKEFIVYYAASNDFQILLVADEKIPQIDGGGFCVVYGGGDFFKCGFAVGI